ncbi:MAG: hypothetical protein LC777_01305, partial [Actinobacteria bacterium]|nr:hypothetical protein [Actinomycetota bacterium]
MQIAVVATARKLTVLCWHMITRREDYAFARPSLTAKKLRALELRIKSRTRSEPPSNRAASLLWTTHVRQVSGRSRNRGASTTTS